eukprot:3795167-Rhodomonas_salina.2
MREMGGGMVQRAEGVGKKRFSECSDTRANDLEAATLTESHATIKELELGTSSELTSDSRDWTQSTRKWIHRFFRESLMFYAANTRTARFLPHGLENLWSYGGEPARTAP